MNPVEQLRDSTGHGPAVAGQNMRWRGVIASTNRMSKLKKI